MSVAPGIVFTIFNMSLNSSAKLIIVTRSEGGITRLERGVYRLLQLRVIFRDILSCFITLS